MRYGFIGLGNLGAALASNLVRAGFQVVVHDLNRAAAAELEAQGAAWAETVAEIPASVDAIITCLPSPAVSENVLDQVLPGMTDGLNLGRGVDAGS